MKIENSVTHNEAGVSRLAYQLWENAGRPAGRDLEFWLAAENQLRAARVPVSAVPMIEVPIKENASKSTRSTRGGVKKTWPKPYPNLPKF